MPPKKPVRPEKPNGFSGSPSSGNEGTGKEFTIAKAHTEIDPDGTEEADAEINKEPTGR